MNWKPVPHELAAMSATSCLGGDNDLAHLEPALPAIGGWASHPELGVGAAFVDVPIFAATLYGTEPSRTASVPDDVGLEREHAAAMLTSELDARDKLVVRRAVSDRRAGVLLRGSAASVQALGVGDTKTLFTAKSRPLKLGFYDHERSPARFTGFRLLAVCAHGLSIPQFAGSGATAMVALQNGRRAIGTELNPKYLRLQDERTQVTMGLGL